MLRFLHRLLHPHCQECRNEANESKVCESCETLKMQLAIANAEKRVMLESILEKPKPEYVATRQPSLEELKPKQVTWNVRRQMLEAEDRKAAELLRQKTAESAAGLGGKQFGDPSRISIEKLEKELGVEETNAKSGDLHGENRAG